MAKEIFVADGTGMAVIPREIDWNKIPSIGWPETLRGRNFNKIRRFAAQFGLPWFKLTESNVRAKKHPLVAKSVEALLEYDWADDFDRPLLEEKAKYAMQILRDFTIRIEEEIARNREEETAKHEAFLLAKERVAELMESKVKPLLEEALIALKEMEAANGNHSLLTETSYQLHSILNDPDSLLIYRKEEEQKPAVIVTKKT